MNQLDSSGGFGRALSDSLVIYLDFDQSGLGPTPPEVAAAACRLLGISESESGPRPHSVGDIYHLAQEDFERFERDDPSGRSALLFVAYVSTFFHEARHVHDLLSTGFGVDILAAHNNYYQNALPLAGGLRQWQEGKGTSIPLPIDLRHAAVASLNPRMATVIERYRSLAARFEHAGAPGSGIYAWMSCVHLLEASAGTVQLDVIHDLFGEAGILRFDQLVRQGVGARKYMWLINDFLELLAQRQSAEDKVGRMLAFLLWVALQAPGGGSCSDLPMVTYFHALSDYVTRSCGEAVDLHSVSALVDRFNALWNLPSTSMILAENRARARKRAEQFTEGWQAFGATAPAAFADVFNGMRDAHLNITDAIEADPELYFVGRRYAHAILGGLLPALRIDYRIRNTVYTGFTPGQPCLGAEAWDKAALYSAILSVLVNGRCRFPVPHIEELAFEFLTAQLGLRFTDALFA